MYSISFVKIRTSISFDFIKELTFPYNSEQVLHGKVQQVFEKYSSYSEHCDINLAQIMNDNQMAQLVQITVLFRTTNLMDEGSGLASSVRKGSFHIIQKEDQTFYVPLYLLAKAAQGKISNADINWFVKKIIDHKTQQEQAKIYEQMKEESEGKTIIINDLKNYISRLETRSSELKVEYTAISREHLQQKQQIETLEQEHMRLKSELKALYPLCDKLEKENELLKKK